MSDDKNNANPTKAHARITDASSSALRRYQCVVVGSDSIWFTMKFELANLLFGRIPGALGFWLRQRFFRSLFKRVGRGVVFGAGLTIRHPRKITIGDAVVISDGCVLDAGGESNRGIDIGSQVMLGQNAMLRCKNGDITIGRNTGIGAGSAIYAVGGNRIEIGCNGLIAPFAYIGGGQYKYDRTDIPIVEQGPDPRGGNSIGDGVWMGARVTVVDGANIGRDAIVAAGSVVMQDIPPLVIAGGNPARVLRDRRESAVDV
jgi:acetyltransferase-like isoleucine patch superfamily enzyme